MVPKEAPSGYCMLSDKAPSVAPSVIISLIGFPVPPPRFEVFSLHPDFRLV